MSTASSVLRAFKRSTAATTTTTPISPYADPVDHVGDNATHTADQEYISRRELCYQASMDYDRASTPSLPDSGAFSAASSVYSNDDAAEVCQPSYFSHEGVGVSDRFTLRPASVSDVSYAAPVEPFLYSCSNGEPNDAAKPYDVSDLQEQFGMSVASGAAPQAGPSSQMPSTSQAEDTARSSGSSSSQADSVQGSSGKKSSKAEEAYGAENPDAMPTAGGIKLGSRAKEWGSWEERMEKQGKDAGVLIEEIIREDEAKKASEGVEAEKSPKSKSTTGLLKRFKSLKIKRSNSD